MAIKRRSARRELDPCGGSERGVGNLSRKKCYEASSPQCALDTVWSGRMGGHGHPSAAPRPNFKRMIERPGLEQFKGCGRSLDRNDTQQH